MNETKDITYLRGVIRRRKNIFSVLFLSVMLLAVVIAFALPPIYLAKSTILIEGQQIPQEYVQSTITGYVEERLQMITQQIMSHTRLFEIINRFNLYPDLRKHYVQSEIVEKMRDDIILETISADVLDRRTGRPTAATIAFALSYEGKDPVTVQRVAGVLASLYLEENLKNREERATTTTTFLQRELDAITKQIDDLEAGISTFKQQHLEELPEYTPMNIQAINRLDNEIARLDAQVNALKERKILLEGQIANVDPLTPIVTEDGRTIMNPAERLKNLRLQLVTYQGIYSAQHPDVMRLKQQIQELESQVGATDDATHKIQYLNDLKGRLATMQGKLGAKHPDVVTLTKQIAVLSREIDALETPSAARTLSAQQPDNPAYINLTTQIATAQLEIANLHADRRKLQSEKNRYQNKINSSPLVEKEYNGLLRDYEMAKYKYAELMNKHMEAKVAQGMEETQRGEKFTIVDPAQLPDRPYKPNRLAIVLIGFVLALGAAVGGAAARESLDTAVKSADHLGGLTAVPVLAGLSLVQTDREVRALKKRRRLLIAATVVGVISLLLIVNYFVMPLDMLWFKIQRKVMLAL